MFLWGLQEMSRLHGNGGDVRFAGDGEGTRDLLWDIVSDLVCGFCETHSA